MQNEEPMCYITYAVPAHLLPELRLQEMYAKQNIPQINMEEPAAIYPPGFMPDWFLSGSFPEDDFED